MWFCRKFLQKINTQYDGSSETIIKQIVKKCLRNSSVENQRAEKYSCSGDSEKNIDFVRANVTEEPKRDINRCHKLDLLILLLKDSAQETYNNNWMALQVILQMKQFN